MGRLDDNTAVITLFSFRDGIREGHLCRSNGVVSYLVKFKHVTIRIRDKEPDASSIPITHYEWEESVYGKVSDLLPQHEPLPKGKQVVTVSYYDANLYHKFITGRSVARVLHFLNKTLVDWFSKKKATVKTATCGSEYSSA